MAPGAQVFRGSRSLLANPGKGTKETVTVSETPLPLSRPSPGLCCEEGARGGPPGIGPCSVQATENGGVATPAAAGLARVVCPGPVLPPVGGGEEEQGEPPGGLTSPCECLLGPPNQGLPPSPQQCPS